MQIKLIVAAVALALTTSACSKQVTEESTSPQSKTSQLVNSSELTQDLLNKIGQTLDIQYRLITNIPGEHCDKGEGEPRCFVAAIDLTSQVELNSKDWAIYYSQMRPIQSVVGNEFTITQVQGDLHKIEPAAGFKGIKKGETITIEFRGEPWLSSETDAMPNYYIVAEGLAPVVIASTQLEVDPETGMEVRPYVTAFTDSEAHYKRRETDKLEWAKSHVLYQNNLDTPVDVALAENSILPTPNKLIIKDSKQALNLKSGLKVDFKDVDPAAVDAALQRLARIGVLQTEQGVKTELLPLSSAQVAGEYRLDISADKIQIFAADDAGFSYGLASIAALVNPKTLNVSEVTVEDAPRYDFRGMHVDVSRNFHSKQLILDLLDQMAAYKLNKLHLHMADDEGWRLEINGLPELTEVGSKRCHDLNEDTCLLPQLGSGPFSDTKVNGYYSKADYIEILKYANDRQIQVIPSMDMPGHSRAAIKSMEARYRKLMAQGDQEAANEFLLSDSKDETVYSSIQYYNDNTLNVCMESTFNFIDKVIDEIAVMHKEAGVPLNLYHIGADETAGAWIESPLCKAFVANNDKGVTSMDELGAYFIERTAKLLADKGIEAAGWSDGMSHTRPENMPAKAQSNIWDVVAHGGHKRAHQQANLGWHAVLSQPEVLYFDFPYEADPKEHGYYWASRNTNSQKIHSFMPGNLPANAEQWTDIENLAFEADDTVQKDESGKVVSAPLKDSIGFAGIQGQLWSETIRSDDVAEYMMFPRIIMLAERAWHKPSWEVPYQYKGAVYNQQSGFFTEEMRQAQRDDWYRVANTVGSKELLKLDKADIAYRVPTPGAVIKDGKLFANVIFPGLDIEYRTAGGDWLAYEAGVAVTEPVEVRVIAADGKRKGRTLVVE